MFDSSSFQLSPQTSEPDSYSVSDAVGLITQKLNSIPAIQVVGEVTSFRGVGRNGHAYFEIKDAANKISVTAFNGVYKAACSVIGSHLQDGMKIVVTGSLDFYGPSGRLSLKARAITLEGEGLLRQKVMEIARRLDAEGLMDPARKRHVPRFCERIAVVTSLTGSVIEDVKQTLERRNKLVKILCVDAPVQGKEAPPSIIRSLQIAASYKPDCILLVRGGGSYEDLMCFNDEALARAVAACPVPVVTGIGHEPDDTICDKVSDLRCSTPTAAAESIAPTIQELEAWNEECYKRIFGSLKMLTAEKNEKINRESERIVNLIKKQLEHEKFKLETLSERRCLTDPTAFLDIKMSSLMQTEARLHEAMPRLIATEQQRFDQLRGRFARPARQILQTEATKLEHNSRNLHLEAQKILSESRHKLKAAAASLEALSPLSVLARGYSITRSEEGKVVSSVDELKVGELLELSLAKGSLKARVESIEQDKSL